MNSPLINSPPHGGDITAAVPKDHLRSLFYLFTGKPDSRIKIFNSPVALQPSDLLELNSSVNEKLKTHHIDVNVTSAKIGYDASQFAEFSTWAEFEGHRWTESEKIQEIVVKWDFLVNMRDYAAPQRHTLLLRISRDIKPSQIFHMLGAGNADELDKLDEIAAPAFCRVDFINAQLSRELIALVEDWYKGRPQPRLINPTLYWVKQYRNGIATFVDQWLLLSWALLVASLLYWGFGAEKIPATVAAGAIATLLAIYSLSPAAKLSHKLASKVYATLSAVEGRKVVFNFTAGDRKHAAETEDENKRQGWKFVRMVTLNIALNIVATIIYTVLFTGSGGGGTVGG
ncbi:hypothetical protein [Stenotrophomonas maltophilia]|uniref:hypothetical protein n=1 Tax=Stenotrophomonas maltophilia TaxID=40324 RepID=UPI001F52FB2E|nr:hypothetical protein [Stenotrophomonas maltophilia]MCI1123282.1 hypothetical protein [Stenotrophomonas maltophilia]